MTITILVTNEHVLLAQWSRPPINDCMAMPHVDGFRRPHSSKPRGCAGQVCTGAAWIENEDQTDCLHLSAQQQYTPDTFIIANCTPSPRYTTS
jgi:hypothetical protein